MNAQANAEPWTLLRLITWTKDYLAGRGIDSPRLAAELLLAHVLGCPRMALYTQFARVATEAERTRFRELVKRAADHEPVAYLVGHRDFYSLDLAVTPDVLIPRPETEGLVDRALDHLRGLGRPGTAWDACTGSGAVAVAVAANARDARVLATDISEAALAVARTNASRHALTDRLTVARADLLALPADAGIEGPFDVITANPPYVTAADMDTLGPDVRHEPVAALCAGAEGLDFIAPLLRQAPDRLAAGGLLAMEIGYNQAEAVWDLANTDGRYERISFDRDAAGIERVLAAYRKA
ncbi:MAG: peptide chain release factor N(5)-glutamine methyltransferase [Planctomycetes bacterium]|nr:peptide chain release factor N(5)-glutamine methyltransferase [Planctomycetota bacterium]